MIYLDYILNLILNQKFQIVNLKYLNCHINLIFNLFLFTLNLTFFSSHKPFFLIKLFFLSHKTKKKSF